MRLWVTSLGMNFWQEVRPVYISLDQARMIYRNMGYCTCMERAR